MKIITLDAAIRESLRLVPLNTGANLSGFEVDLVHALSRTDMFQHVTSKRTDDGTCKLIATCSSTTSDTEAVVTALQRVWNDEMRYAHFEAHALHRSADSVILRFVTRSGNKSGDLCVTGKIIASGYYQP